MAEREVVWSHVAGADLDRLDRPVRRRIIEAVARFAATDSGNVRRLADVDPPEYRLRVGQWRVRFLINGQRLMILRVLPRDKAYK